VEQVLFLILAAGALYAGANVVFRRNPAICAVFLVFSFVCVSGMFLMLGFPFMAAMQLMVYAGAIMVLFVFVVMLLNLEREAPQEVPYKAVMAPLLAGAMLGLCGVFLVGAKVAPQAPGGGLHGGQAEAAGNGGIPLADALFGRWLLPFEATGLLLLAALLGVIVLAKRLPSETRLAQRTDPSARAASGRKPPQPMPAGSGAER
jgi:NADH-quinone oxidoreductase subunit J